ncbi:MAG TPA: hypothetical protein VKX45_13565 [Bryobacteraceae bacterium]|jgi:hypothetical protein|nr:hypothetical protein [Bryobacteraceae bacterium]
MLLRRARWLAALCLVPLAYAAVPKPAEWVPARWPWADVESLDLLRGSPVNCLLLAKSSPELIAAAGSRGIVTLIALQPGPNAAAEARSALAANAAGLVLDGDFADAAAAAVREAAGAAPVIELGPRSRMPLGSPAPIIGTDQGVWPGIVDEQDARKAGPTGSAWIDTNTGFVRAVRAWGDAAVWLGNRPPAGAVITRTRYLQAIADAAISGARWVLAFDPDFAARLHRRDADALADWRQMNELLRYFESHPEWRAMREYAKLAVVQDPAKGGLLSGGILDMIAVKHTPVKPVPPERLSADALNGATMAVNVDPGALTPAQQEILRNFTRSGNTVLNGPPGWQDAAPGAGRITLDQSELTRLNEIWRDINSMIGRRNLGVRLFNVSSMLSNVLSSADGKTVILHLVNYSDYPVENVTVHFSGGFRKATLLTPEGVSKPLAIYREDDAQGVDIDKVSVCATIQLEQ